MQLNHALKTIINKIPLFSPPNAGPWFFYAQNQCTPSVTMRDQNRKRFTHKMCAFNLWEGTIFLETDQFC